MTVALFPFPASVSPTQLTQVAATLIPMLEAPASVGTVFTTVSKELGRLGIDEAHHYLALRRLAVGYKLGRVEESGDGALLEWLRVFYNIEILRHGGQSVVDAAVAALSTPPRRSEFIDVGDYLRKLRSENLDDVRHAITVLKGNPELLTPSELDDLRHFDVTRLVAAFDGGSLNALFSLQNLAEPEIGNRDAMIAVTQYNHSEGGYEGVLPEYERLLADESAADRPVIRLMYASALVRDGRFQGAAPAALEQLDSALQEFESSQLPSDEVSGWRAHVYFVRANIFAMLGRMEEAGRDFGLAVSHFQQTNPVVRESSGGFLARTGLWTESLYSAVGDFPLVERILQSELRRCAGHEWHARGAAKIHFELGCAYYRQGRLEEAGKHYERALYELKKVGVAYEGNWTPVLEILEALASHKSLVLPHMVERLSHCASDGFTIHQAISMIAGLSGELAASARGLADFYSQSPASRQDALQSAQELAGVALNGIRIVDQLLSSLSPEEERMRPQPSMGFAFIQGLLAVGSIIPVLGLDGIERIIPIIADGIIYYLRSRGIVMTHSQEFLAGHSMPDTDVILKTHPELAQDPLLAGASNVLRDLINIRLQILPDRAVELDQVPPLELERFLSRRSMDELAHLILAYEETHRPRLTEVSLQEAMEYLGEMKRRFLASYIPPDEMSASRQRTLLEEFSRADLPEGMDDLHRCELVGLAQAAAFVREHDRTGVSADAGSAEDIVEGWQAPENSVTFGEYLVTGQGNNFTRTLLLAYLSSLISGVDVGWGFLGMLYLIPEATDAVIDPQRDHHLYPIDNVWQGHVNPGRVTAARRAPRGVLFKALLYNLDAIEREATGRDESWFASFASAIYPTELVPIAKNS